MPAGIVTRQIGESVTIRYRDVALFNTPKARELMASLGRTYLGLALQEIAGHISDEAPVGVTGHLAQSWGGHSQYGGIELLGQEIEQLRGRVFSSLPHAIVIDQGRRPGAPMPPIDAIMLWVERTFGISSGFDDDELEQTAWAVAKSIARKGIKPRHYVEKGVRSALPRVEAIFRALGSAINAGLVDASGGDGGPGPVSTARRFGGISSAGAGGGGLL